MTTSRSKTCPVCAGAIPTSRRADCVYCSDECQWKAFETRRTARRKAEREQARIDTPKLCKHCEKPIPEHRDTRAHYCSPECKSRYANALCRVKYAERKVYASKICPHCGVTFTPKHPRTRFCGQSCAAYAFQYRESSDCTSAAWYTPEVARVSAVLRKPFGALGAPLAGPY